MGSRKVGTDEVSHWDSGKSHMNRRWEGPRINAGVSQSMAGEGDPSLRPYVSQRDRRLKHLSCRDDPCGCRVEGELQGV